MDHPAAARNSHRLSPPHISHATHLETTSLPQAPCYTNQYQPTPASCLPAPIATAPTFALPCAEEPSLDRLSSDVTAAGPSALYAFLVSWAASQGNSGTRLSVRDLAQFFQRQHDDNEVFALPELESHDHADSSTYLAGPISPSSSSNNINSNNNPANNPASAITAIATDRSDLNGSSTHHCHNSFYAQGNECDHHDDNDDDDDAASSEMGFPQALLQEDGVTNFSVGGGASMPATDDEHDSDVAEHEPASPPPASTTHDNDDHDHDHNDHNDNRDGGCDYADRGGVITATSTAIASSGARHSGSSLLSSGLDDDDDSGAYRQYTNDMDTYMCDDAMLTPVHTSAGRTTAATRVPPASAMDQPFLLHGGGNAWMTTTTASTTTMRTTTAPATSCNAVTSMATDGSMLDAFGSSPQGRTPAAAAINNEADTNDDGNTTKAMGRDVNGGYSGSGGMMAMASPGGFPSDLPLHLSGTTTPTARAVTSAGPMMTATTLPSDVPPLHGGVAPSSTADMMPPMNMYLGNTNNPFSTNENNLDFLTDDLAAAEYGQGMPSASGANTAATIAPSTTAATAGMGGLVGFDAPDFSFPVGVSVSPPGEHAIPPHMAFVDSAATASQFAHRACRQHQHGDDDDDNDDDTACDGDCDGSGGGQMMDERHDHDDGSAASDDDDGHGGGHGDGPQTKRAKKTPSSSGSTGNSKTRGNKKRGTNSGSGGGKRGGSASNNSSGHQQQQQQRVRRNDPRRLLQTHMQTMPRESVVKMAQLIADRHPAAVQPCAESAVFTVNFDVIPEPSLRQLLQIAKKEPKLHKLSTSPHMGRRNASKVCDSCKTTKTPVWREVDNRYFCNACGLRYHKLMFRCPNPKCRYVPHHADLGKECGRCGLQLPSVPVKPVRA
ncbi:hypothetical protein PTSG_08338 [Salpingoeca rosetta]|uniref:GATA-type domain-containing protein n=1 Tax=Salpingoeca rosetta (strain ATCC 50818 / BSB-021) TaxID=946362 RepID=F2UJE7_SALR5|nr:uncharacterized protein PTSG_08338 [Salpingoeca rosetta]EGD77246.1 hypothetical protein PTSG_08338 [Salpingoeca rosetta]|eukprot:XP_004990590.1 hypothetical protein PTSG_08338 [Salpingoeca rosetta]